MSNADKGLVFINSPISDMSDDIIGFSSYAYKLQNALDYGAKMIAVTSPFGSGKSSLSKLLEENLQTHDKYKCVRLSLWPQLLAPQDNPKSPLEATDLHRYFLYQLVSKINPRRATYVGKKLNGNYGLWKLHIDDIGGTVLIILSAILFISSLIIGKFIGDEAKIFEWSAKTIGDCALVASVVFFVIALWKSEILFSSRKSEGQRVITPSDIVEIFKKYILKHNSADRYVVIIEDLDRTDDNELIISFLKELRKYYVEDENGKVAFIVNIKPESFIHTQPSKHEEGSREALYSKLFDYTLNLQSINISDYDAVLGDLLRQKEDQINRLLKTDSIDSIPAMEWIIRGRELSIRVIKDRLNRAFSLYESLTEKFSYSPTDFRKCAAAAYLTMTFESDFYATDHEAFGLLVEAYIRGELKSELDEVLSGHNGDYKSAVEELVRAHLIDDEYHKYYYNYPQNARIYYSDELVVRSGILYGTKSENLYSMAQRSLERKSSIFEESFEKIKRLGILIPDIIMETEPLYVEALRYHPEGVYEWIKNLDYNDESKFRTIDKIISILSFDRGRSVYNARHAKKYSEIWSKEFRETVLLSLRERLCETFPQEISWYNLLFEHPHTIISNSEINYIELSDAVSLVDTECDTFGVSTIKSILAKFRGVWPDTDVKAAVENLIRCSFEEFDPPVATTDEFLEFMDIAECIPPDFEEEVFTKAQDDDTVFERYQNVIGKIDVSALTDQTLDNIDQLDRYEGFSEELSTRLYSKGYYYTATLIRVAENYSINYDDHNIRDSFAENITHLVTWETLFYRIRIEVIHAGHSLLDEYQFLFGANCPVINQEELNDLGGVLSEPQIMKLIPAELVTDTVSLYLIPFLNQKWHNNNDAYSILLDISTWDQGIAADTFYKLDFADKFQYGMFAREKQNGIRKCFTTILDLDSIKERIRFMTATHWIDPKFDSTILSDISDNEELWKKYLSAINKANARSITKTTISNICGFSMIYPMDEPICSRLFQEGKYMHYVISTILRNKRFVMEDGERLEILWPIYIKIFSSNTPQNICGYMCNNIDFLNELMRREEFISTSVAEQSRKALAKVNQSAQSIRNAMTYGQEFAIDYFSKMVGFIDRDAAVAFLDEIESSPQLLTSDRIYDNAHDKLVDPLLKARYTRRKNHFSKE